MHPALREMLTTPIKLVPHTLSGNSSLSTGDGAIYTQFISSDFTYPTNQFIPSDQLCLAKPISHRPSF